MLDAELVAAELYQATKSAQPVELLSRRFPDLDWNQAREVARATDDLRRRAGETQIGWKLGWTSAAMREALGVDRPNWGTLWQSQVLGQDDELNLAAFIHPKVEPELVWRCPARLSDTNVSADDIARLGGHWALGLEIVDPRYPSFHFDALDNTADNSSSAAVVIGEFAAVDAVKTTNLTTNLTANLTVDLTADGISQLEVSFTDGSEIRLGVGANAMDSPLEAVAWFARAAAGEGLSIEPGQIVFTGGLTAPFDVSAGCGYRLKGDPLPAVSFTAVR